MSYWVKKGRAVYIYTRQGGKSVPLPRKQTKHLDNYTNENLDLYVKQIDGIHNLQEIPHSLEQMLKSYLKFLTEEGRDYSTVNIHKRALCTAFEYFVVQGHSDPRDWPHSSIRLRDWLIEKSYSTNQILRVNLAIRKFWKFHVEEGNIQSPLLPNLRNPRRTSKTTPLKRHLTPVQVLLFARNPGPRIVKIMAVAGYFFFPAFSRTSRPQQQRLLCRKPSRANGVL